MDTPDNTSASINIAREGENIENKSIEIEQVAKNLGEIILDSPRFLMLKKAIEEQITVPAQDKKDILEILENNPSESDKMNISSILILWGVFVDGQFKYSKEEA